METPHIAIPRDLADRFPDIAAQLQPREPTGGVFISAAFLNDAQISETLLAGGLGKLRRSGFMLPDADGGAAEHIRLDVKGRWDCTIDRPSWLSPSFRHTVVDRCIVALYGVGDHFAWHRDDMVPATANRLTALSFALNDPSEYGGGELELPEYGVSLKPPKGSRVAFPASALHRVTPITRGVRKVLLTFILKETAP